MIPWSVRWQSWRIMFWRRVPVFFLSLILALMLFLFVASEKARPAVPPPSTPEVFIMHEQNLVCFERFLAAHHIQVKAVSGIALGPEEARQAGTGTVLVRVLDKNGQRFLYLVETVKSHVVKCQAFKYREPGSDL